MGKIAQLYKRIPLQIKITAWFLFAAFMQKGISIITTPIFSRIMSTSEYGEYATFSSWLSIITVFLSLNLYNGFFSRGIVKSEKNRHSFASSILGLETVLFLIFLLVYLPLKNYINQWLSLSTIQVICMFTMILATSTFNFWSVDKRFDQKYKPVVLLTVIASILKPVVGIILVVKSEDKVTARIFGLTMVECLVYAWCYFSIMKNGRVFYNKESWKDALIFGIPLIPHYLSVSVLNGADKIMIKQMIGSSEAGIYGLAYSVSQIMLIFNMALVQALEPSIYRKIKNKDFKALSHMAYPSFLLIAIVNLFLIILAPEVISIFGPKDYYEAIFIIPPITMSSFFLFLYSFFSVFEFYHGATKYVAIATTGGALLNIVLNWIFIDIYGYFAAGYTTLFCYMIYALAHYCFMIKVCKKEYGKGVYPYDLKYILIVGVGFMVLGFLFLSFYHMPIIRYTIVALCLVVLLIMRRKILRVFKSFFCSNN